MIKPTLPQVLSLNGGYVDTAGFLALQGLFTAHVTGNFVTLGASLVFGTSGVIAKLLALPVFCLVIVLVRLLGASLGAAARDRLGILLGIKLVLLAAGAALALALGPFTNGDSWPALATGLVLVCAMAIQNAVQRVHLSGAPPTTLMTGNTTQVMIDLADLLRPLPAAEAGATRSRLKRMAASILAFAVGCALAALSFAFAGMWCFVLPPLLALAALPLRAEFLPPPAAVPPPAH